MDSPLVSSEAASQLRGKKKTVQLAIFDKNASRRCRTAKPEGTRRSPRVETATQPAQHVCFSEMQTRSDQKKKGSPEKKKLVLGKKKNNNNKQSRSECTKYAVHYVT